jgi:hypothetical protein
MRLLAWLIVLTVPIPGLAEGFHVPVAPPARFDHPHPNMVVRYLTPAEVDALCRRIGGRAPKGLPILGCSKGGPRACAIVLPLDDDGTILRHERAHCNGWPPE